MTTRHDMLVELASDQVSMIRDLVYQEEYEELHTWLQPLLLQQLKLDFADFSDDDLQRHYCDQLGVDIPSSPPLSSPDEPNDLEKENAKASW